MAINMAHTCARVSPAPCSATAPRSIFIEYNIRVHATSTHRKTMGEPDNHKSDTSSKCVPRQQRKQFSEQSMFADVCVCV